MKNISFYLCLLGSFLVTLAISPDGFAQNEALTQRQVVLNEVAKRPNDLWPRGDGHVLIAEPGSPLSQKGYYEPGGSFSPSPGSFGMALWVIDKDQHLVATSDNIPMSDIKQKFVWHEGDKIPSIYAETPYYSCTWRYRDMGVWDFELTKTANSNNIVLVFRSVGPAGGPVSSAVWDKAKLYINRRWVIVPSKMPTTVIAGDEKQTGITTPFTGETTALSSTGWAFAKLGFDATSITLKINDTKPVFESPLHYEKTVPQFTIDVPDQRFMDCINAQTSNLLMGYIGRQTGPGEPVNYPLAWERDGAYSLISMAKSGNLQTARELSVYFAENDFFGGFGAEGDAPGSEINALSEVAFLIDEPEYYQWVWPHIERKLTYIDEMLNATDNVYKNFIGPLVPPLESELKRRQLICLKFDDGLIQGTMDNHFPALYINAISYRGLIQASRLAQKLAKPEISRQCTEKAAKIKAAWLQGFGKEKYDNERNFMISIYPSWITDKSYNFYLEKMKEHHDESWGNGQPKERPLWTYFTNAKAHQFLFVGKPEYTWETLHYFWNNQCSPGLYTFWEGNGEENSFHGWDNYRGWLNPKYVTPHYWTASEMLLLQLDMLAYFDESASQPELVVGGGVPAEWLTRKFGIDNFRTKYGTVSWHFDSNNLTVAIKGAKSKFNVRAGSAFGANTKINVEFK